MSEDVYLLLIIKGPIKKYFVGRFGRLDPSE